MLKCWLCKAKHWEKRRKVWQSAAIIASAIRVGPARDQVAMVSVRTPCTCGSRVRYSPWLPGHTCDLTILVQYHSRGELQSHGHYLFIMTARGRSRGWTAREAKFVVLLITLGSFFEFAPMDGDGEEETQAIGGYLRITEAKLVRSF